MRQYPMSSHNVPQAPIGDELNARDKNANDIEIFREKVPLEQIKPNSETQESRHQSFDRGRNGSHPVKGITPGSTENWDKAAGPSPRSSETSDSYKNSSDGIQPGELRWKKGG